MLARHRFALRAGRARFAAAGVAALGALGMLGLSGTTPANAQAQPAGCVVNLLGQCLLGGSGAASTPTPAPTLCILVLCNSSGTGSGSGSGAPNSPTPCALPNCLPVSPNPNCNLTANPACVLGGPPTPCPTNCGPHSPPPVTQAPGGGGRQTPTSQPRPTGTLFGFAGNLTGGGGSTPGSGTLAALGLSVANVPVVQQLSPVSGLQFGHAPILWPLFGVLDLLGFAAVYYVVRRTRGPQPR